MSRFVALVGPTAAGKTGAALALAEGLGGEIVSCDSIAVYRGCDIGAAKPTAAERARVAHHLLDVVDPDERFSAADYVARADGALAEIAARGRPALVVGGSGLYLRALADGLFPSPRPDLAFRERLNAEARERGWPDLHARLAGIDPAAAARIAPTDPVRIERALEVHHLTGEPISALQARHRGRRRHALFTVLLDPGPLCLERRIAARAEAMIAGGLLDETRRLAARYGRDIKPLGAVGYKEALACLEGRLARAALGEVIRIATRQFARRQRSWFRKHLADHPGVAISDGGDLPLAEVAAFFAGTSAATE